MKVYALIFAFLALYLPSLTIQSQSLADIAKKERERRKRQQAQSRIYLLRGFIMVKANLRRRRVATGSYGWHTVTIMI